MAVSSESKEQPGFDSKVANAGEGGREEKNARKKSTSFQPHFAHPSPV